jgi:hypothetical protein
VSGEPLVERGAPRLRTLGLAAVTLNLLLLLGAVAALPQVLGSDRTVFVAADVLILLVYAAWLRFGPAPLARSVLLGLAAGLIQFGDVAREYFTAWPVWLLLVATLISLGLFAASGVGLTRPVAAAQGVHAAIATMLLLWVLVWGLDVAESASIGAALAADPDYRSSGLKDLDAYIVWNTLSAAFSHALLLPTLGLAAAVGGTFLRVSPAHGTQA